MKQLFLTLTVSCWCIIGLFAQEKTITGTVTSAEDELPVIGANILVKGTSSGTITDVDGKYELTVPGPDAVLLISYTGMKDQEITVGEQTVIDLVLSSSAELLEEIVVVGYGVQKKRVSTGAISKLSEESLDGFKVQNVQSALEGQVTGLIVNESSGQPGAGQSILIRGISTNGDNTPLFIVDGLQVNSIDNINPGDIESIDVLKDAASSAIYGARGANGVIIITTKKGVEGVTSITYDGFIANSEVWRLPEMLGADDYIALTREKFANGNQSSSLETLGFPQPGAQTANTDWMNTIFQPASNQSHRLNVTGKGLFLSLEYWDQNGVVGNDQSNYKRYAARLNTSKDINWLLSMGQNLYVNRVDNQNIGVNDAFGTVIADAFAYDPLTEVYDDNGQYGFAQSQWVKKEYINPLSRLFLANNQGHGDQVLGNLFLEVKPFEGLKFRSDLGLEYTWYKFRGFTPDYAFHDAFINPTNDVFQGSGFSQSYQFENYLNYNKDFGPHSIDIVLGTSIRKSESESTFATSSSIPDAVKFDDNWQYIDAGQDTTDLASGAAAVDYALLSYYGRIIYDLQDKYLFTATLRRDGSSNFGANNRWGLFPSFSLGWVLSDELFFNVRAIDFMKVRGSWGVNGNDRIAPLTFASTIQNVFTYPLGLEQSIFTGAALATPPNPDIKWEESVQLDIGLEIRMFESKLTAEIDYYKKTTKDLLMNQAIPGYVGATNNPISNLGEIENEGLETGLGYRLTLGDFRINTKLNYTTFTNTVIKVAGDAGFLNGYSWPVRNTPITRMTEGFPVGHFVGYQTDGIFQSQAEVFSHLASNGDLLQPNAEAGDLRFVDVNNDGVINSEDITNIGSPWPDHILGFSLGVSYKGFDFSAVLAAQIGHDIYRVYERSDITFTNYQTFWLDRWTPENPGNTYPRLVSTDPNNNQRPSDFYVEDGSFMRLRNLQIGYNIPTRLLEKAKLTSLRIYLSANNLLTVTNYSGFDPDIGSNGWILDTSIDKGFYPVNKTIGGGIKITM